MEATPSSSQVDVQKPGPKLARYALVGFLVGSLLHYPILLIFFQIAIQISEARGYNSNADTFMGGIVCGPLAVALSALLGLAGGWLGLGKTGRQPAAGTPQAKPLAAWILAGLGGLLGPILFMLPFTIAVLSEWAGR